MMGAELGGLLALHYAAMRPQLVKSVILCNSFVRWDKCRLFFKIHFPPSSFAESLRNFRTGANGNLFWLLRHRQLRFLAMQPFTLPIVGCLKQV